ncbi:MAG: hypothetical protein M9893_04410 [Pyrinomonadaceae bacterium]|nr:hypothetical protein [Pyrinomonadaceae bacterium]
MMKFANKAYVITLLMLSLVASAAAQHHLRSAKDPRNTAPTVGTGGPFGGPTGLFTVYDGSTLRRGEFTFSAALSNWDRDPGNVDLSAVPLSFQVGLTDHVELFFETEAYRQVRANALTNLSSAYLPNTQFWTTGGLQVRPAIILAPQGPGPSMFANQAVYRPIGAPWFQFPFTGGSTGNFGLSFPAGPSFGFGPGTTPTMGPPQAGSGNGAGRFPGVGSVYGSILPGIVLQTVQLTSPTGAPAGTAPTVFTTMPSYLPDAPFISRSFADSAFNSFTAGAKFRLTSLDNPIGFGFVAAYRWYADSAKGYSGFNQLQRGASPGGDRGDVYVATFADARLAKWVNLSANVGFLWASDPKGSFPNGTFKLLDRSNEVHAAFGIDFPVNKFFQPILELRTLQYVGGRTPNAFENHPIDGIAGARIFPARWWGLGFAYRFYNFNQQDWDSVNKQAFSTKVTVPCYIGQSSDVPGTSPDGTPNCVTQVITSNFTAPVPGFQTSSDANGYIAQLWIGRRDKRESDRVNSPADVTGLTQRPHGYPAVSCRNEINVRSVDAIRRSVPTTATDKDNDPLVYNYTVSGGRVVGQGSSVSWDLSGVRPGTYTITAGVDDRLRHLRSEQRPRRLLSKKMRRVRSIPCVCPSLSADGPAGLVTHRAARQHFTANVRRLSDYTYNWTVSNGAITSGQGTSSITVATTREMADRQLQLLSELGGTDLCMQLRHHGECNCGDRESAYEGSR